ncbi:MAG: peptide deformylase [Firmicutes bacterium]|nr:peptide deformylase [Bacillota bacterium]
MAIRQLSTGDDPVLRKRAAEVNTFGERLAMLIDDLFDTLEAENGVGLAAPQVGISRRIIVVKIGEDRFELVNPILEKAEGRFVAVEGCLSLPGLYGEVERAARVLVRGRDRTGKETTVEGDELLARALQHEIDHLDGILFTDKALRFLEPEEPSGGR